jgi:hypothetical protein
MKENDSGEYSSDYMVLWLGRRQQNEDMVEWWEE